MKSHDCKGSDEFHGRCDKNQDGLQKHDTESKGSSDSHNLINNAEDNHAVATNRHGNCSGHEIHEIKYCHNQNICENLKGHESRNVLESNHDIHHEKSGCHSDFDKHGTGEISIDVDTEHVKLASMHACSSLEEKEKGSCCEGCSDTCENLPAVCDCESSSEKEDSACCRNEGSSKECKESPIMHVCLRLDKREVGGCCKSYIKECCAKLGHSRAGFIGGLSEIITE